MWSTMRFQLSFDIIPVKSTSGWEVVLEVPNCACPHSVPIAMPLWWDCVSYRPDIYVQCVVKRSIQVT